MGIKLKLKSLDEIDEILSLEKREFHIKQIDDDVTNGFARALEETSSPNILFGKIKSFKEYNNVNLKNPEINNAILRIQHYLDFKKDVKFILNKPNVDLDLITAMNKVNLEYKSLLEFYNTNQKFSKLIDSLSKSKSPNRIIKGSFAVILIGGGSAGVVGILQSIAQNKNRNSGCWRHYKNYLNVSKRCLIREASCTFNRFKHDDVTLCDTKPEIINEHTCDGWSSNEPSQCRRCDINADPTSLQYLDKKHFVNEGDIYKCVESVNLLDVIVDVAKNLPDDVWNTVRNVGGIIFSTLKIIIFISLFLIILIPLFKIKDVYNYIYSKFTG